MKKVIIIGSTSGIGKGLAELFAANNCKVGIKNGERRRIVLGNAYRKSCQSDV